MARNPKTFAPKSEPAKSHEPSVVNPKHQAVVQALMEGATQQDALRAAGYHPSHAHNVIRTESVQGLLKKAREEVEDICTIRKIDVMSIFIEAIDMARIQADPANMINGADKVAKMMGYYAPETKRIELSDDGTVLSNRLRAMSDSELLDLAAKRAKVVEGEVIEEAQA